MKVMNLQQERNEDQRDRPADIALLEYQVLHRQRFCGRLWTSMLATMPSPHRTETRKAKLKLVGEGRLHHDATFRCNMMLLSLRYTSGTRILNPQLNVRHRH